MKEMPVDLGAAGAAHADWMSRAHDRLEARLAAAFLETVWGTEAGARREFDAYRQEVSSHLRQSERRLFEGLTSLDARTRALERFEWKTNAGDLRRAFAGLAQALRVPMGNRYEAFAALRRALRRQRRHERHLLTLTAFAAESTPHTVDVFL